ERGAQPRQRVTDRGGIADIEVGAGEASEDATPLPGPREIEGELAGGAEQHAARPGQRHYHPALHRYGANGPPRVTVLGRMASQSETLAFALSDADIKSALDLLRGRRPKDTYRELWILLTVELERRRLKGPPAEIRLARQAFEALPAEVRALLRAVPGDD